MRQDAKDDFVDKWNLYFGDAELPIAMFYSDGHEDALSARGRKARSCVIEDLSYAREGKTLVLDADTIGCPGGRRYLGFSPDIDMKDFEYFLSCGIPGKLEGERYKKSPELVKESMKYTQPIIAPKKRIVFKRWDKLTEEDEPEIVIFFAKHDVLSGLFTLANFEEAEPNGVICPFGSGCSSIVYHPYAERKSQRPRCVIGMFDISARPYVGEDVLTFAAPFSKFVRMVDNMDDSFLTTDSWTTLMRARGKD